jgi:uracil-DNA glycosylase family 4
MAQQQAFFLAPAEILFNERQKEKEAKPSVRGVRTVKSSSKTVYDCETCGLYKGCRSPKMARFGQGKKKILIIGEAPGSNEDREGKQFVGDSGKYLKTILSEFGINMDVDCVRQNVVRCRPPENRLPQNSEMKSCYPNLLKDIEEVQPHLIICLGEPAIWSVLDVKCVRNLKGASHSQKSGFVNKVHGFVFPYQKFNCWVGCSYHPASVGYNPALENLFIDDMHKILSYVDKPLSRPLDENTNNYLLEDCDCALDVLMDLTNIPEPVATDFETTTISPYDKEAKIHYVSFAKSVDEGFCIWLENPNWSVIEQATVYDALKRFLKSSTPKIIQNFNMEESWSRQHIGTSIENLKMDTMITSHVINCRGGTTGLDFQVFRMTGHQYKNMVNVKDIASQSVEKVVNYNCLDSRYTFMLYEDHSRILNMPGNEQLRWFNDFLTQRLHTLVDLKERGVKVDRTILTGFEEDVKEKTIRFQKDLSNSVAGKKFLEKYETDLNVESPKHLRDLLFGMYGAISSKKTKGGDQSVEGEVLQNILAKSRNTEVKSVVKIILDYKKTTSLRKRVDEYAACLDPNGFLHPEYMMHTAETYRSSASPNVQNMFKHDEELVKFRSCIVPLSGCLFLEADQDALEFKTTGMVSGDPTLILQIKNKMDPHRRWASELYQKQQKDITDEERFNGKNGFVFASIYGALPESIAKIMNLPVEHVIAVQKLFWEEYHYLKEWQNRILTDYQKNGYVEAVTGFRRYGPLTNEQLFNTPIQGPAFHLVLAGIDEANKKMKKEGFRSTIISETHDSVLNNTYYEEVEALMELQTSTFCAKRFEWQRDVPLSISWCMGENYYEMEKC